MKVEVYTEKIHSFRYVSENSNCYKNAYIKKVLWKTHKTKF